MKRIPAAFLRLSERFAAMPCGSVTATCATCRHHLPANDSSDEGCVLALVEARAELGLGGMTLEETARRVGLERSRVGVIEKEALAKLRRLLPQWRAA